MKKIQSKFLSLSLVHQLLILLGTLFVIVVLVVYPYINNKLEYIVDEQIYQTISDQQNQLIDMIENVDNWEEYDRFKMGHLFDGDNKVKHLLFYKDYSVLEILTNIPSIEAERMNRDIFYPEILEMEELNLTQKTGSEGDCYYMISESPTADGVYWISYEKYDLMASDLLSKIQNELLNILYLVLFVVLLVLVIWIYSLINPLKNIVGVIQSIKKGEAYEMKINRQDEIGEVSSALIEMDEAIKREQQLQADLIHNISHDLKTPITIIQSYSESMKDGIYPYGDAEQSLDVIIENTKRLEKKVKDFLLLNRLDYIREHEKTDETCRLDSLILRIVSVYQPMYPNIEFKLSLEEATYLGSEELWSSCITNIIENALRYAKSYVEINLTENKLTIFNDGEQIESSVLNDLFKPYKKGPKGNFGLGLSIVYKIVNLYGYEIEAENRIDGVAFVIQKKVEVE